MHSTQTQASKHKPEKSKAKACRFPAVDPFEEPAEGCVCTHSVIPKPQLSRVMGNKTI